MPSPAAAKASLRRRLRASLADFSLSARERASARIRELLAARLAGSPPLAVAAFAALPGEPDLLPLLFTGSHRWHLPRVAGQGLELHRVTRREDLASGAWGIREPDPAACPAVSPRLMDLFLVPGLGFDPAGGHRLGRGKGFYDRLLAEAPPGAELVGVGFDLQLAPLPGEPHDIPLHALVTESGWRRIPREA